MLTRSDYLLNLLYQVAAEVAKIEEPARRVTISTCTGVLAGLLHDQNVISNLFGEEIMQESSLYQYILQKGVDRGAQLGRQEGRQEEALSVIIRLMSRKIGAIAPQLHEQIRSLSIVQLEDLSEALLDFSTVDDLVTWLRQAEVS